MLSNVISQSCIHRHITVMHSDNRLVQVVLLCRAAGRLPCLPADRRLGCSCYEARRWRRRSSRLLLPLDALQRLLVPAGAAGMYSRVLLDCRGKLVSCMGIFPPTDAHCSACTWTAGKPSTQPAARGTQHSAHRCHACLVTAGRYGRSLLSDGSPGSTRFSAWLGWVGARLIEVVDRGGQLHRC